MEKEGNKPKNAEETGDGKALHRPSCSNQFSTCECIGVIQNATSCVERLRNSTFQTFEGILEDLSDWFVIDRPAANGADKFILIKPNEFFFKILSTAEAFARGIDFPHGVSTFRNDFSFRILVGHNSISFLSNVEVRRAVRRCLHCLVLPSLFFED